jgi:hypothetical protein
VSLAMMLWAGALLARATLADDIPAIAITALAAVLLVRWRVDAMWLIAGGAVIGIARTFFAI